MDRGLTRKFFQVGDFAFAFFDHEARLMEQLRRMAVRRNGSGQFFQQRETRGIVAAIFETFQSRKKDRSCFPISNVSDNSAHKRMIKVCVRRTNTRIVPISLKLRQVTSNSNEK